MEVGGGGFVETKYGTAAGGGFHVKIVGTDNETGGTNPNRLGEGEVEVVEEGGVAKGDGVSFGKEPGNGVVDVDCIVKNRNRIEGVGNLRSGEVAKVQDIGVVGVGFEHVNSVNIKWNMSGIGGELTEDGEDGVEGGDGVGGVERKEWLYGVAVAPEGVGTDDDAALRGVVVHFGTIVLRIGVEGDAAGLAEVAIVGRAEIVVFGVGAEEVGLLPMEEVGMVVEGGEADTEGVAAMQSNPLVGMGGVGEKGVGPPMQAVGIEGGLEMVSHTPCPTRRVGHREGIDHCNTHRAGGYVLRPQQEGQEEREGEDYEFFGVHGFYMYITRKDKRNYTRLEKKGACEKVKCRVQNVVRGTKKSSLQ